MNILFRCDGSVEIGLGHVVRCLTLADHLKENHDCNIHFSMRKSELGINKVKKSYPVIEANEQAFDYEDWLSDCIYKSNADILVMDMRDGLLKQELKQIKKKTVVKVVTIDDPEDKRLEADLAFYPPVPQLNNMSWEGFNGKIFSGWEYVILRKEFSKYYPKPNISIPNILISMGAADNRNMTKFAIYALNEINEKFKTIIIVGSGYLQLEELKSTLNSVSFKFELHQNPDNIAEIMSQSNFAVISFGQTAYEFAALKIPAIYLCLTDDHFESSKLFMNEGIGTSLGVYSEEKKQDLVEAVLFHIKEKHAIKSIFDSLNLLNISNLEKISSIILG